MIELMKEDGIDRFAADMQSIADVLHIEIDRQSARRPATPFYFRALVLAQIRVVAVSLDILRTYPNLANCNPSITPRSIGEAHVHLLFHAAETFDCGMSEILNYLPMPVLPGLKEKIEATFAGYIIYPARMQAR